MRPITEIVNVRHRATPTSPVRWLTITIDAGTFRSISEAPELVPLDDHGTPRCQVDGPRVDGGGAFVAPGLINLHTHLFRRPRPHDTFDGAANNVSLVLRALLNGRDYLARGVTTIRDVGAPADLDIALARLAGLGAPDVPRVFATGRPITQTGGHNHDFGVVADGPIEIRRAVRERVLRGADWIKLMASQGGTRFFKGKSTALPPKDHDEALAFIESILERADPDKVYTPTERDGYTLDELTAATDEATRQGVPTVAHAVTAQSVINCVEAGLTTVEHGTFLDPEAAAMLAGSATVYVPTVSTVFNRIAHGRRDGWGDHLLRWSTYVAEPWFASVRLAHRHGVRVAVGTDAGGDMNMEMLLMERAGYTRHEVLYGATAGAADVLGRSDLGRLEPSAVADLILLARDPLDDLRTLETPLMTVLGGKAFDATAASAT